jgi:hypothetical protein
MKCVNCNTPNPERWFYCKSCGNRASEPIYTTNLFMMSEGAKRSDVEFSVKNMDEHIASIAIDKKKRQNKIWQERIKQAGVN